MYKNESPLSAWFLGPKAENSHDWESLINNILQDYIHWRKNNFPDDPIILSEREKRKHDYWLNKLNYELNTLLNKLKAQYPFYSPRYLAHMLSEQTLPSVLGYFAGMLYNSNNVTNEAAPITVDLELEYGREVAKMLGFDQNKAWVHITSGGTIANIEALWVSRMAQFQPLIVKEYCEKNHIEFKIKTPKFSDSNQEIDIREVNAKTLISLRPNESIYMVRKLIKQLRESAQFKNKNIQESFNSFVYSSKYNISTRGFWKVINEINLKPVIFVSASAHYSIKKAANLLGYGEDAIKFIPVNKNFRMDTDVLYKELTSLNEDEYVACVIGIAGTTEEGVVDPIHKIILIRNYMEKYYNTSFWLHVDAAWGGFIRTLFIDDTIKLLSNMTLEEKTDYYIKQLNIKDEFNFRYCNNQMDHNDKKSVNNAHKPIKLEWSDHEVIKAFLAFEAADSITVDPHKLGYVPYPAGIIAFRNCLVTELIKQRAQYINDEDDNNEKIHDIDSYEITKIGPYILEGSKPGAAAAACWLSAKCIPLNLHNHGKIIKTTLLNAKKLQYYLYNHSHIFKKLDKEVSGDKLTEYPFTFTPIYDNCDTNVICFIALPMKWDGDNLVSYHKDKFLDLDKLNALNKALYKKLSIDNDSNRKTPSYLQEFFVSKTVFESVQYSFESLSGIFSPDKIYIDKKQYNKSGLFVLRSSVMNPWYYKANFSKTSKNDKFDYFYEFLKVLHKHTRSILIEQEHTDAVRKVFTLTHQQNKAE